MGKNKDKNKDEIPNPTSVANRDILQRLNFLYQASVLLNGLAPSGSAHHHNASHSTETDDGRAGTEQTTAPSRPATTRKKKKRRVVGCEELSRSYVETMKIVGQKTNVKIDPSVKRRICKRCSAPLIPGVSATVRIKDSPSHGHLITYQCLSCKEERRIPAPRILHVDSDPQTNEDTEAGQAQQPTDDPMPSDAPASAPGSGGAVRSESQHKRRKKRGPHPRLPPHFARDVGHVVFRGNERLDKRSSDPWRSAGRLQDRDVGDIGLICAPRRMEWTKPPMDC